MADSPWNAKHAKHSAPEPFQPESAKAQDFLLTSPAAKNPGQANPPLPQPQQPQQQQLQQQPQRSKRAAGKSKPLWLIALVFALLALVLTAAAFSYAHETARLNALVRERDEVERKAQAHRAEHLSARARSGYLEVIRKYAEEYNISPSLVSAIIKCESSFNPAAVSRVEARGLMQIMPDTGVWLAGKLGIGDYSPERLYEADLNIRMGTYYLAYLSDVFSGSPVMVAAAYHAGDGNVKRWALSHAEDLKTITAEQIPAEDTRSYVRKVMDAYAIYYAADSTAQTGALPGAVPDAGSIRGAGAGN